MAQTQRPAVEDRYDPASLSRRIQLGCAACVPIGMVVFIAGMWIAGYIPPPPADATPEALAGFYSEDTTTIRFGLLLSLIGFAVWGPLIAVITTQMKRRREYSTLAYLQLVAGGASWQFLLVPVLFLTAAAFRPERDPEITQALHDAGWILLFLPLTTFVVQSLAIALATLTDSSPKPLYPRWVGYVNLTEILLFLPVALLTFFKTGPFAYHGVLVFWVPLAIFCVWMLVMSWATFQAALEEPEQ